MQEEALTTSKNFNTTGFKLFKTRKSERIHGRPMFRFRRERAIGAENNHVDKNYWNE